ncbi:unnamed protein product [Vicia faba]|uniref:Reverse transcriptase zinc-binding domain-containing protein n=1 Tax=Vicia faba TaxID=3906 RepID=A0AAV0YHI1_VICFA|nr:unnamed protein product [Vicia faba]
MGLYEKDSRGDYYTWSNKQPSGTIYSRIDRVIGNLNKHQQNIDTTLCILEPGISDHALLCFKGPELCDSRRKQFKCRQLAVSLQGWDNMLQQGKFNSKKVCIELKNHSPEVSWKSIFFNNFARPHAKFTLWMACHNNLATKERLHRFSLIDNDICCFCSEQESLSHLFFKCSSLASVWRYVLQWIHCDHQPQRWNEEINWVIKCSKEKGHKVIILKAAFTETVYEL